MDSRNDVENVQSHSPRASASRPARPARGRLRTMLRDLAGRLRQPTVVAAGSVLHYSGLLRLSERARFPGASPRLTILMYHRVSDGAAGYRPLCVSTRHFAGQMQYLARGRRRVVSLATVLRYLEGKEDLEQDCVAVTFDDGYRDNFTNAFPILQEFGIPATIFLTTGLIDSQQAPWWDRLSMAMDKLAEQHAGPVAPDARIPDARVPEETWTRIHAAIAGSRRRFDARVQQIVESVKAMASQQRDDLIEALESLVPPGRADDLMLTWEMVQAMRGGLVTFGSHTVTHPMLHQTHPERIRRELHESKARIESALGEEVDFFSYPNGAAHDLTPPTVRLLGEANYRLAVTTQAGTNDRNSDPLLLRRYGVSDAPAFALATKWQLLPVFNATWKCR